MGLDMYLTKHTYVKNWDHMKLEQRHKITVLLGGKVRKDIKRERICSIVEEVGYWRKANAIHKWFVDNCQDGIDDCRKTYISTEQLKELYKTCNIVLASIELVPAQVTNGWKYEKGKEAPILEEGKAIKDPSVAQELLPSHSGFFFGGTDYDEWYVNDLKHTIKILDEVLKDGDGDYYYQSSW